MLFAVPPVPAQAATPQLQINIPYAQFTEPEACGSDSAGRTVYCNKWLGQYISGIYKYALGVLGILAALAMMLGGIIWLTAGGDAGKVTTAKSWITGSITGLVIGFSSYFILYQISPDLLKLPAIRIAKVNQAPAASGGTQCSWQEKSKCDSGQGYSVGSNCSPRPECDAIASGDTRANWSDECNKICCCKEVKTISTAQVCQKYASNNIIEYKNISDATSLPWSCGSYDQRFKNVAGTSMIGSVEAWKFLKALAATESNCNSDAKSGAGACGLMQLMPGTAQSYAPAGVTIDCEWLKNNPEQSIRIAYAYIRENMQKNEFDQFAGYNSGYGKTGSGALAPSVDCPGVLKYQCCINPQGLAETQDHVYKSVLYLKTIN